MLEARKTSIISSLVFGLMVSSIYLVTQVYDFRVTFSEKDKVNNKYESLSFKKVGPKHFKPDQEEITKNPRSRSAILRVVEKVA